MEGFLGQGMVNNAGVKGLLEIVDGGHNVVDHLIEVAPWGRIDDILYKAAEELGNKEKNKNGGHTQGGVKTNIHT